MEPIRIEGATPSSDLRRQFAESGQPVLLAFSRGKDSIAAWLAPRDAGVEVIPYHLYLIPGLSFVDESLAWFEDWLVRRADPEPAASVAVPVAGQCLLQPPERVRVIEGDR